MRPLRLMAIPLMVFLFVVKSMAGTTDTTVKINHVTDGNISEWKADRFEVDKETNIAYAVDHDANNIYLAVKVSDQPMQMKIMMQGMSLFLDKKGKKKEGTGIEFPVKREGGGGFGGGGGRGGGRGRDDDQGGGQRPDPKEMRERLASTMIFLKTFGFDDQEDKQQLIAVENGVNVAFDWDDANNFYIEYLVPVKFLGTAATLNGKPLGIGWKINGMSMPASSGLAPSSTTAITSSPRGGGGGGRGGGGAGNNGTGRGASSVDFGNSSDSRFREQSIWTKYTINF